MAITSAFQMQASAKTITVQTNVAPSTSQSTVINLTDMGLTQWPQSLRMINNGTVDIWVYPSNSAQTAAFPTAGTVTAGTPQPGFRLKPGVVEVFALSVLATNPSAAQPPVPGFFLNTIASVASQQFDVSPGEGL